MGWQVTRTHLGTPYPNALTPAGTLFKQIIENLSGGNRPLYDEGFVGPSGGAFAFNFGAALAGPGRENLDTTYQFDTSPALSPEEQQFNTTIIRIAASTQDRDKNGIFNTATSSPYLSGKFKIPVLTRFTWSRRTRGARSPRGTPICWSSGRSAGGSIASSFPPKSRPRSTIS